MQDNIPWFWEGLDAYLVKKQLKQTKQRRVIVEKFLSLTPHVDIEKLHELLKESGHAFGLATIYRTLNLLKDAGLVDQKNFTDGQAFYELRDPYSHHDHLVCIQCKTIVEFENLEIERLQKNLAKEHGFKLLSHKHELYGLCPLHQDDPMI